LKLVPGNDTHLLVAAQFKIQNTGTREGAEVAQVYVCQQHPSLPRPLKELKGFKKVMLQPGESRTISIPLDRAAFAYYDPARNGWVAEQGEFDILAGDSSRDLPLKSTFALAQPTVEK
jgi:beta-glucosidase